MTVLMVPMAAMKHSTELCCCGIVNVDGPQWLGSSRPSITCLRAQSTTSLASVIVELALWMYVAYSSLTVMAHLVPTGTEELKSEFNGFEV